MRHLLTICSAKDKAVRFRACQAISKTLHSLDESVDMDDIWEDLEKEMLERTADKIPIVRVQAINALGRLQDTADADCPIVNTYLARMTNDSSPGEEAPRPMPPCPRWRCSEANHGALVASFALLVVKWGFLG